MSGPRLPRHAEAAAMLTALADWIEDELASGKPPKWVALVAARAARYVAAVFLERGGSR